MTDISAPSGVKELMGKYDLRCRKRLGQNFLVDANIVNKIISSASLERDDVVVEIGPGLGVITRAAASGARLVVSVELDRVLLPALEETLQGFDNIHIVAGDAMDTDFDSLVQSEANYSGPYKLIANLPYYITTPLIMRLLLNRFNISLCVIMVQNEVAERITALPGGKEYGSLSVAVQYFTEARYLFKVPRTVFIPRPEVDSAVILLARRERPPVEVPDEDFFFRVVRGAFGQRRKTLLNALSATFDSISRERMKDLLQGSGIDPGRRGETLGLEEFAGVTKAIYGELPQPHCIE
ncbi:MAG: 16S rRNA methyltransferase [Peptococcaceae bacterium BICA1-7]|nr:MAG: 16S rRNA methyltransferase [Peptococcaceae bacterium BICA1-7]HBV99242.1 16S rRNA (adenine(1518)-N(6)/adenine(1519)-N(6))-dimethyltransferase RsmA [Desulfotomaculum sp.]